MSWVRVPLTIFLFLGNWEREERRPDQMFLSESKLHKQRPQHKKVLGSSPSEDLCSSVTNRGRTTKFSDTYTITRPSINFWATNIITKCKYFWNYPTEALWALWQYFILRTKYCKIVCSWEIWFELYVKVGSCWTDAHQNHIAPTTFGAHLQYQISLKSVEWYWRLYMTNTTIPLRSDKKIWTNAGYLEQTHNHYYGCQ